MSTTHTDRRGDGNASGNGGGMADQARGGAADLAAQARESLGGFAAAQREAGASAIHDVAQAAHSVADQMERTRPEIARYAREAASVVDDVGDAIRNRSIGDVIRSVDGFARREPLAFFGTALLAGFAVSRFLGSSSRAASRGTEHGSMGMGGDAGVRSGLHAQGMTGSGAHVSDTLSRGSDGLRGGPAQASAGAASATGSTANPGTSAGSAFRSTGAAGTTASPSIGGGAQPGTKPAATGSEFARHTDGGAGLTAGATAGTTGPTGATTSGGATPASAASGTTRPAGASTPTTPPSAVTRTAASGPSTPARGVGDAAKPSDAGGPAAPKH